MRTPPRVAVFGIGLAAYWPQFDGLRPRLEQYQRGIERRLEEMGAEVVSAGLVDTPQSARVAGEALAARRPELLLVYTATYATSSQVLPVVQAVDAPVVVLNLQPSRTVDYEAMTTGEWLANCSACCVPEIAGALTRAAIPYRTITGTLLDGDPAWSVLSEWLDATRAVHDLRTARIGFLGHTYPGMLDMYSDFTQVHAQTGAHVEVLEIDDLVARVESAGAAAVESKRAARFERSSTWLRPVPTRSPQRSGPRSSSGRRVSPSASISSWRISSSMGSPTTTAASRATLPSK